MKKIISLILALICVMLALVSCSEVLEPMPEHYEEPKSELGGIEVELVIPYESDSNPESHVAIARQIANYTQKTYNVKLTVNYVHIDKYEKAAKNAVESYIPVGEGSLVVPDGRIVLVNSAPLMDKLSANDNLLDLTDYLFGDKYGTINKYIPAALINAAKTTDGIYALPNNRVLGEYTYLVISEEVEIYFDKQINAENYTSYADTLEAREKMELAGKDPKKYVTTVTGNYATRDELIAADNFVIPISKPQITSADAFASAFAILDSGNETVNDKTMQLLYAMNTDKTLRNLLQYGIEFSNYEVVEQKDDDGNVVYSTIILKDGKDQYRMEYTYTGNVFVLDFCEEIGWNAEYKAIGEAQNAEVVYVGG